MAMHFSKQKNYYCCTDNFFAAGNLLCTAAHGQGVHTKNITQVQDSVLFLLLLFFAMLWTSIIADK